MREEPKNLDETVFCSWCHALFHIRVQACIQASPVIQYWQDNLDGLCPKCLKEERGDMNGLGLLIAALIMVESSGNDSAIGDDGRSVGPLGITEICRADVNRFTKGHPYYTREDCFNRDKAVEMFHVYISHYCTRKRLGRDPQWQDVARIWNGGPDGWKESATLAYWEKVRKELHK